MAKLNIKLAGSYQTKIDENPVTGFSTDKARALLAYLAVERANPHRRESLAALLWPDQSDERARQSLRQALSHIKHALGGDDFLLSTPQDVQIHPQADIYTDVGEIHDLVQACEKHHHRRSGACLPCIQRKEKLARLYSGEFLAGFPSQSSDLFEEWIMFVRERLHVQAMQAFSVLADYHQHKGEFTQALRYIREQIRLEPWREEAYRQAMRLHVLNGETSAALVRYETCCRELKAELGVEPSSETNDLYELIKTGKMPFPKPIANLPEPSTAFIGRNKEKLELAEMLADPACRLITLHGPGGIGKTHLAHQVAHNHAGLFKDGVFLVPMVGVTSMSAGLDAIAESLGLPPAILDSEAQLKENLRKKEMLIVLDNFEHLIEGCEVLGNLIDNASDVIFLVTSRERLRLHQEWVFTLEGLSYPSNKDIKAPQPFEALQLFEKRASQVDRRFKLNPELFADVVEICQLVEGLPLAIELAASAVCERTCAEIANALSETFDILDPSLRNLPKRHHGLRAVFEHSWQLLPGDDQVRLAKLSVFRGGFEMEAAIEVAGLSLHNLDTLVAKSLVTRSRNGRYMLHESIRQFAAQKNENYEVIAQSHGAYYSGLLSRSNGVVSADSMETIRKERANLRAAWLWSYSREAYHEKATILLKGLSDLYMMRGPISEGENLFRQALANLSQDPGNKNLAAKISLELARLDGVKASYAEAIDICQKVAGETDDILLQARAYLIWGQSLDGQGECESARPILEKALKMARQIGQKQIEADSLRELGNAANRLGEHAVAIPYYKRSLNLGRELGDKRGESASLNNWATMEWELGNLPYARELYLEAQKLYQELGNLQGEAKVINNLSNVAADQGDLDTALLYCEQALQIHQDMGNPRGQSAVLNNMGANYFCQGNYAAARKCYKKALVLYRESSNRQAEAETLANLSSLDCVLGNLVDGRENAQKAIGLSEQVGDKINQANAFYYLGRIELADHNFIEAETSLSKALSLRSGIPHPGRIAEIQAELAWVALQQGDPLLARQRITPVVTLLDDPDSLHGADEPERIRQLVEMILKT
jgi:predicted ATPase/DNA-binding SARP family transcriptional activator